MLNRRVLEKLNQQLLETSQAEREIGRNERRLKYLQAKLKVEQTK